MRRQIEPAGSVLVAQNICKPLREHIDKGEPALDVSRLRKRFEVVLTLLQPVSFGRLFVTGLVPFQLRSMLSLNGLFRFLEQDLETANEAVDLRDARLPEAKEFLEPVDQLELLRRK